MTDEARAAARRARNDYMKKYRQTPQGAERIREAQARYWARKSKNAQRDSEAEDEE